MYFLEIDLRINTTINFKDFKYALEKYELDFDWESGFNEFWDTKNGTFSKLKVNQIMTLSCNF